MGEKRLHARIVEAAIRDFHWRVLKSVVIALCGIAA
jgi:hypothetical protein